MQNLEDYKWNPSLANYCLTNGKNYIVPTEPLHIGQIEDHKLASEMLQKIYIYRYGFLNTRIGVSRETDIQIATNLGVL